MKRPVTGATISSAALRNKAETQLLTKAHSSSASLTKMDAVRMFHELQVHHIELEMQNAELQLANDKTESDREAIELLLAQSKISEQILNHNRLLLEALNESLEMKIQDGVIKLREQDKMLLAQNRQAAMGEMIGNIAHQWRQPLNILGLTIQRLPIFYGTSLFDKEYLDKSVHDAMRVVHHLSQTIDDFKNFFTPEKELVDFEVNNAINTAVTLISDMLRSEKIKLDIITPGELHINGYPNEYSQVLLNIIINAYEALLEHNVKQPLITVSSFMEKEKSVVTISDNAGGISEQNIERVFEPYFTTKGPNRGTGIGLYMAKTIIENNMGGRLTVCNKNGGAEFRVEV